MAHFEEITSQDQLDAVIGERLRKQERKIREEYEGYLSPDEYSAKINELNESLKGLTTKATEYEKSIAERDAKIKSYELASVKSKVAHELGLSYDAISFIRGDDEDSVRESASALKSLVGNSKPAPPVMNEPALDDKDPKQHAMAELVRGLGKRD